MDKVNQNDYIKYLEERLKKLSKKPISDQDLNTLIDVQNEIIFNDLSNKHPLKSSSPKQIEQLQKRILISDKYIQYLTNSFWWKITYPARLFTRHIQSHLSYKPFNFSTNTPIKEAVEAIIYAESANSDLTELITNLREQENIQNLTISIIDLIGSKNIAKIAKNNNAKYINMLILDKDITMSRTLLNKKTKYVLYINQDFYIKNSDWLYKAIRPLVSNYALMSALYDKRNPHILSIENGTFFKELKARIIEIGNYKCLYLPTSRNNVQCIPVTILDQASVVAKKVG